MHIYLSPFEIRYMVECIYRFLNAQFIFIPDDINNCVDSQNAACLYILEYHNAQSNYIVIIVHSQQATEVLLTFYQQVRVIFPLVCRDNSKGRGIVIVVTRPSNACTNKMSFFQQRFCYFKSSNMFYTITAKRLVTRGFRAVLSKD